MATTDKSQTINNVNNRQMANHWSNGPSYSNITDMMMNNMLMSNFGEIMKGNYQLTLPNICKLLLLTQVGNAKKLLTNGIDQSFKGMKHFILQMYFYMCKMLVSLKNVNIKLPVWIKPKVFIKNEEPKEVNEESKNTSIEVTHDFMKSFYLFLIDACEYEEKISSFTIKNSKDLLFNRSFKNVIYNGVKILSDFSFIVNKKTEEIISYELCFNAHKTGGNQMKSSSYRDYLTDEQRRIITMQFENNHNFKGKTYKEIIEVFFQKIGDKEREDRKVNFTEENFVEMLLMKHPYLGENETLATIFLISYIYYWDIMKEEDKINLKNRQLFTPKYFDFMNNKTEFKFDVNNNYNDEFYQTKKKLKNNFSIYTILSNKLRLETRLVCTKEEMIDAFKDFECSMIYNPPKGNKTLQKIMIDTNESDFVFDMIDKIKTYSTRKEGKNISINKLTVERKVTTKKVENEVYTKWKRKIDFMKESFSSLHQKEEESPNGEECEKKKVNVIKPCDPMVSQMMLKMNEDIPDEFIEEEEVSTEIKTAKVNEDYRKLSALYLRKDEKYFLNCALEQFKENKELMKELGFDNKLNILLYGEPGTGKTTTIMAIASYLQKDIYYVNLKEVKTNKDIHMVFEHVNKNVTSGGIIVLEDIDCMSDVVLKRNFDEEEKELSVNDIFDKEDDEFNLSYLLNLLQGCMTMDDSVVILTTNHKEKLDPAVIRDGRMNLKLELKACDRFQIQEIFNKLMRRKIESDVLERIEEFKYTPAKVMFHIKNYMFCGMTDEDIMKPFL